MINEVKSNAWKIFFVSIFVIVLIIMLVVFVIKKWEYISNVVRNFYTNLINQFRTQHENNVAENGTPAERMNLQDKQI